MAVVNCMHPHLEINRPVALKIALVASAMTVMAACATTAPSKADEDMSVVADAVSRSKAVGEVRPGEELSRPKIAYAPPRDFGYPCSLDGQLVRVKCTIQKSGEMRDCRPVGLTFGEDLSPIVAWVSRWRFEPVTNKGQPVDVDYVAQFRFAHGPGPTVCDAPDAG